MRLQWFSWRYFSLGSFSFCFFSGFLFILLFCSGFFSFWSSCLGKYFFLDSVGISFSLLSILLFFSLLMCSGLNWGYSFIFLGGSVIFSILCYTSAHVFLFWGFYELSILFLLLLLVVDSPYSERFIASWYLLGYVVFTRLPMFLCILYVSLSTGSYNLCVWGSSYLSKGSIICLIILSILFITKIPLFPFHVWLPIVHAEAPSPVSVCLRGYIMKLGVLGLYRFSWSFLPDTIFSYFYVFLVLVISLSFFLSASRELDGKRWLAFLSLAHISIVCLGVCVTSHNNCLLPYYFCLGHGLSAGATFILLWLFYDISGSRNWGVLKSLFTSPRFITVSTVACLFTAASVPPTITFMSEVLFLPTGLFLNSVLIFMFCIYLFLSGLVPLFLLAYVAGRSTSLSVQRFSIWNYFGSLFFLILWMYLLFVIL